MKIITLVENTKKDKTLKSAHGLSFYIEWGARKILFDVGPSRAYIDNAEKMGINLAAVDTIIISHGHSDHCGGLKYITLVNTKAVIYLSEKAVEPHWLQLLFFNIDVGIDLKWLVPLKDRIVFIQEKKEIFSNAFIILISPTYKNLAKNLRKGKQKEVDDFAHEMIFVIARSSGLVVFSGCSHNGITEIAEIAIKEFENQKILALFGGFHFIKLPFINNLGKSKTEIGQIASELMQMPIEKMYSCHCTGNRGNRYLKEILGDKLEVLFTGAIVSINT
ncbi:hypothetical protein AwErysi_01160 [Erysipelotrichaceae bacterium]|nr:hypothetical protein AwErysi_01160 [Erysipelotrichaceae bacterium]